MEDNIKVFGATATAEAPLNTEDVAQSTEAETTKAEVNQETDQPQAIETSETASETNAPPSTDKSEEFKVSFNEEQKPIESAKQETVTEEMVSKFLKDTYNLDVKNLAELSKPEVLPEEVAKFKKFYEDTGKGHKDFQNAQKDWGKEPKDDTIKEYLKYENPNMSQEDIEDQLDLLRVTQDDEDELEPRDLKRRKLEYNKEYSKALEFMGKKAEELRTPEKASQAQQKPPTAEEIAKAHEPYWKARNESLKNLNEIDISIDGIGDIKLQISQEHKDLISKNTETQDAFFSRWQNKDGAINTDKSSLDTAWSIPEVRKELIASMLEQANALIMDKFSKTNRNVKLDIIKPIDESEKAGGLTIIGNNDTSRAGQPLF